MKTLKTVLLTLMIVAITYATAMTATIITISSMGGTVVGATKLSYGTTLGNLIISLPEPVTETQPGTQLLTAGASTSIGTLIDTTPINDYTLVRVQTGDSESSTNTYTVKENVQKIVTQIPVIGIIPGLYTQNWQTAFISTILIASISIFFVFKFFKRKPKPLPAKTENQIGVLQHLFDTAPEYPTTKTKTLS